MAARGARSGGERALTHAALMRRSSWKPLPSVCALTGDANFLKERIVKRFTWELFGSGSQEVKRFEGPANDKQLAELPLGTVLDELRTPSFFSAHRLVVVESADAFLAAHGEDLVPFVKTGFSVGHLIVTLDGKLDGRTRLARAIVEHGWLVECPQPFDRPPPWETRVPVWESELSRWVVEHAREKGLEVDMRTAFALHQRGGTDLAVLDEEMEKIATYLLPKRVNVIDEDVIRAVVGDLHEDSVFDAVESLLEGRRSDALTSLLRLFERGIQTEKGAPNLDPTAIALLFMGALVQRVRTLRRAHALSKEGSHAERWIELGLVRKPFLARFQRQLGATSPARIAALLDKLYDADRAIKTGASPARTLEMIVVEG